MKMVGELLKEVINVASKSFLSTILLEEINLLNTSVRWLVDFFISGEREHCVFGGQQFIPQLRGREAQPTEKLIKLESADLSHPWERMDCHINVCCLQPRCKSQRHLNYKQLSKFISIIWMLQKLTSCSEKVKLNASPRWNLEGHSDSRSATQLATQLCILPQNCHRSFPKHSSKDVQKINRSETEFFFSWFSLE